MTKTKVGCVIEESGQWPPLRSRYDTAAALSLHEQHSLALLVHSLSHDRWYQQTTSRIPRLVQPLLAVFTNVGLPLSLYRRVLLRFLQGMHQRQTTFWAWSLEEWEAFVAPCDAQWRYVGVAVAYLLCELTELRLLRSAKYQRPFAGKIFAPALLEEAGQRVITTAHSWGFGQYLEIPLVVLCEAFLLARCPRLDAITDEIIETLFRSPRSQAYRGAVELLSRILHSRGIVTKTVSAVLKKQTIPHPDKLDDAPSPDSHHEGIAPEWIAWCQRWYHRSTLSESVRRHMYLSLIRAGRWLAVEHPTITSPAQWTAELVTAYVAAVDRCHVGQWSVSAQVRRFSTWGKPFQPRTKAGCLAAMRAFFRDWQEWEWIPRRFDPGRCLRTPRTVRNLIGPNPRVIDDAMWPKIVDAAMHLEEEDLPRLTHAMRNEV